MGASARDRLLALAIASLAVSALTLPLPALALDALHLAHLALTGLCLARVFAARRARDVAWLPPALAAMTALRLAVDIASSRALLAARPLAWTARGLGTLATGDSPAAALAALALLATAQLVVLARGAERAAEVSARFALDALPGAQLALDADVRSGALDPIAARDGRASLLADARLTGALDGALRFVRGDATLGLAVLAVNLVGGAVALSLAQHLDARSALATAASLAVGQGLLTRVPGLALALAAVSVVTRASWDDDRTHTAPVEVRGPRESLDAALVMARATLASLGLDVMVQGAVDDAPSLRVHGVSVPLASLDEVGAVLRANAWRAVGLDEARAMLDALAVDAPTTVRLAGACAPAVLRDVLRGLVREGVPVTARRAVFEAIATHAGSHAEAPALLEAVRRAMQSEITRVFVREGSLDAVLLHPVMTDALRDHLARRPWARPAADLARDLVEAARRAVEGTTRAVIVCDGDVRWYVRAALEDALADVVVLAHEELVPTVRLKRLATLSPE